MENHYKNSTSYILCSLCQSSNIFKVGNLDYLNSFSSFRVNLTQSPEYWRCSNCDSTFNNRVIPEPDAMQLYTGGDGTVWKTEAFETTRTKQVLEELRSAIKPGVNVLDIGSNYGELLDFAKGLGGTTTGIEPSKYAAEESRRHGHTIFDSIDECEGQTFDIITAFGLVEHLYDVGGFMKQCKTLLKDTGQLIILTGNPNSLSARLAGNHWWYAEFLEHVIFPSEKYFAQYSDLHLKKYISTYDSLACRQEDIVKGKMLPKLIGFSPHQAYPGLAKQVLTLKYKGHPSLGKDHGLIILEK